MHKLLEMLIPSWAEATLYFVCGLLLLLGLNAQTLWRHMLDSAGADVATVQSIDDNLRELVGSVTTLSDPQLVNAVVWSLTAALGVFMAVAIAGFVRNTNEDARPVLGGRGEPTFAERLALRIVSFFSLVLFSALVVAALLPTFSYLFASNVTGLFAHWYSPFVVFLSVLGAGLCLYGVAVLCRLMALRVRVFSSVLD